MFTRTNIKLPWKMILSGLFSLSFLALTLAPASVAAVGLGGNCDTVSTCDNNYICDAGKCVSTDPQDSGYGLKSNFKDLGINQSSDLKGSIANIINIILGFLGIVAVIIILAGGFKWMTAGGNEDKVAESRQMIIQGIIGLVIVFAAWAIASFVISNLQSATA